MEEIADIEGHVAAVKPNGHGFAGLVIADVLKLAAINVAKGHMVGGAQIEKANFFGAILKA